MKGKQKLVGKTVIVNETLIRDIHPVRCEIALDYYPSIQIDSIAAHLFFF